MGKIKSAILTAILVAGIVVLAFFATVSYTVPGTEKVKKYNSFVSSISLSGDLTGEAVAVLYPKGVISEADYQFGIPDNDDEDKYDEYVNKYRQFGSVYVETDTLIDDENAVELKKSVKHDAAILSKRLAEEGYYAYSVAIRDDFTIVVSVPTGYSYAEYSGGDYSTSTRSDKQTQVSNAISHLAYDGELTLRNDALGVGNDHILDSITADASSYFKSFKAFSRGGAYAIKVNLTKEGAEAFERYSTKIIETTPSDTAIGFYVGDNQLLSLTIGEEAITDSSFYITVNSKEMAVEYATVLNSCINGDVITLNYNTLNDIDIVYSSASLGDYSAVFLFCTVLAILAAAIIYSAIRYRLLGFVNALIILMYALTIVVALMLIGIQLSIAGAIFALAGLMLLVGCNFVVFERVRQETEKGKTMQSAIKSAYKALLKGILELHVVIVAVSLILALVCVGELAACGLIFFIASVASYLLYWFTRLMWFIVSSTVRDKFAFCGFKREETEDD